MTKGTFLHIWSIRVPILGKDSWFSIAKFFTFYEMSFDIVHRMKRLVILKNDIGKRRKTRLVAFFGNRTLWEKQNNE